MMDDRKEQKMTGRNKMREGNRIKIKIQQPYNGRRERNKRNKDVKQDKE